MIPKHQLDMIIQLEVFGAEIPHQLMVVVYPSAKNWFNLFLFHRRCRRSTFFQPSPIAFALSIGFCLRSSEQIWVKMWMARFHQAWQLRNPPNPSKSVVLNTVASSQNPTKLDVVSPCLFVETFGKSMAFKGAP